MGGQLSLFKGKRQRGVAAPSPSEFQIHCVVADLLKRWCNGGWVWTHLPMGEYRDPVTAGRLKRMGVNAGWPDFIFMHNDGRVCFLELKGKKGTQSVEQLSFALFANLAGHHYALVRSIEDAVVQLKAWGVLRDGVQVQ